MDFQKYAHLGSKVKGCIGKGAHCAKCYSESLVPVCYTGGWWAPKQLCKSGLNFSAKHFEKSGFSCDFLSA